MGNADCVALVRYYTSLPSRWQWKQGARVMDNPNIVPGTAIAKFVNGKYPDSDMGQHAAFFLRHDAPGNGIWVVDQRKDKPGKKIRNVGRQHLVPLGYKQNKDGSWYWASNNPESFSVIEIGQNSK